MIRLFVNNIYDLTIGQDQAHYLINVMRLKPGDTLYLFDGKSGEYEAEVTLITKRDIRLEVLEKTREQMFTAPLYLAFAPTKRSTNIILEKASELGVTNLVPYTSKRSVVHSINYEKAFKTVREAAEQSNRMDIPKIHNMIKLEELPTTYSAAINNFLLCSLHASEYISKYAPHSATNNADNSENNNADNNGDNNGDNDLHADMIIIGPEGGITQTEEESLLKGCKRIKRIKLHVNTLRSETAAITALSQYYLQHNQLDFLEY